MDPSQLPVEASVSALTMGELAAGPHATSDPEEPRRRQDRLQRAEAAFDPLTFDTDAAGVRRIPGQFTLPALSLPAGARRSRPTRRSGDGAGLGVTVAHDQA